MISNGFQARLLHRDFTSIEETFALTPEASLLTTSVPATTDAGDVAEEEMLRRAKYPSIDLSAYSLDLQPKALKAVRRGAIFVEPYSIPKTATVAAADGEGAVKKGTEEESSKAGDEAASPEVITVEKSTKLLLAFRWIGSEHDNAESAKILDDISEAGLPSISGVGVTPSSDAPLELPTPAVVTPSSAPLPPVAVDVTTQKESKNSLLDLTANLFKRKKNRRSLASAAKTSVPPIEQQPVKEPSFLAQLYIDNCIVPMAYTNDQNAKHSDTLAFSTGALLDLGVVGKDKPDAAAKEILQTITIHLWDASRPDVTSGLVGDDAALGEDIKRGVAPDVVFHFEIVSSGSKEVAPTAEATSIPAHPSEQKGVFVEELQTTEEEVADAEVELSAALYNGARVGTLPPVAEEAPVASTDEEGDRAKTSTRRHTFIDTVLEASRVKFSPLLPSKREPGEAKEGASCGFKAMARRVSLRKERAPEAAPQKEERRKRRASMPSLGSGGGISALQTQLKQMTLMSKPRFFGSQGDNKNGEFAGPAAQGSLGDLTAAIQRSYCLQRELSQVEKERRQLEQQWNHRLLLSFHERVSTLEKRVEEGKQEVKKLRKRAFTGPAPITSTLPPSPPSLPPTLPPTVEVAAEV